MSIQRTTTLHLIMPCMCDAIELWLPQLSYTTPIECAVSYPQPHTDANWIRHQQLNVYNESAFFSSLKPFKNGS